MAGAQEVRRSTDNGEGVFKRGERYDDEERGQTDASNTGPHSGFRQVLEKRDLDPPASPTRVAHMVTIADLPEDNADLG